MSGQSVFAYIMIRAQLAKRDCVKQFCHFARQVYSNISAKSTLTAYLLAIDLLQRYKYTMLILERKFLLNQVYKAAIKEHTREWLYFLKNKCCGKSRIFFYYYLLSNYLIKNWCYEVMRCFVYPCCGLWMVFPSLVFPLKTSKPWATHSLPLPCSLFVLQWAGEEDWRHKKIVGWDKNI